MIGWCSFELGVDFFLSRLGFNGMMRKAQFMYNREL